MAEKREDRYPLGIYKPENGEQAEAVLFLKTDKHSFNKRIESGARVDWCRSRFRVHTFGLGATGDYSITIASEKKTGTQRAIDAQHAAVFTPGAVEILKAQALAHYRPQQDVA